MDIFKRIALTLKKSNPFRHNKGLAPIAVGGRTSGDSRPIVKARPQTIEERYRIVEDDKPVEQVFRRVAHPLLNLCDELTGAARASGSARVILRELGSTDDRRSYLFMKPMNEHGLLMERSGAGWRISLAEKIVGQNLFLRSDEDPWDAVTIWNDPSGECLTRVRSRRFGHELMSLAEYNRRLTEALREIFAVGSRH